MTQRFEDGWLQVNGIRLHYTEWGTPGAPPAVLLHGLNVQCHTWDPTARRLAEHFHVIAPDLRGHGDSDWARSGYRVRSVAEDIRQLIAGLGLGQINLVGHSYGVRVAIVLAGENPASVRRLALSDAGPETTKEGALAMREFIQSTASLKGFRSEDEAREYYWKQHPEWQPEFIDLHVRYQIRRNWAGKLVLKADPDLQWITGSASLPEIPYLWAMSARLEMPTLLMVGKTSNILDEELVERMCDVMPQATAHWFDTGHYIPRERPDEFNDVLLEFLQAGSREREPVEASSAQAR